MPERSGPGPSTQTFSAPGRAAGPVRSSSPSGITKVMETMWSVPTPYLLAGMPMPLSMWLVATPAVCGPEGLTA